MSDHIKPTQDELNKGIQETIEKIEQLEDTPKDPPAENKETPTEETETKEVETKTEEKEEDKETPPTKSEDKKEDAPDFKKFYADSTREAQILAAKNKKFTEAVDQADALPEPTEEELQIEAVKKGFQFDEMDSIQKTLFKQTIYNERKLSKISEVAREGKDIDAWNGKVDAFLDDPKTLVSNPDLEGKTDEFKVFASKPSRRGVDFETLVSSFLYTVSQSRPANKGKMFEQGNGGPSGKPPVKSDKVPLDQASILRETNYKEYVRLLKEGKIQSEVV